MPNWCENDLTIKGSKTEIARLLQLVSSEDSIFDFNKILPMPEVFKGVHEGFCIINGVDCKRWRTGADGEPVAITEEEVAQWRELYGTDGWYDWCIANWGTKWDACDAEIDDAGLPNKVVFHFNTAWSPPVPVIGKLHKLFPTLKIKLKYYEGGAAYKGVLKFDETGLVEDKSTEYHGGRGG